MRLIIKYSWKLLSKIPGEKVIDFAKGILPSIWAFFLIGSSESLFSIDKFTSLYTDSNILKFIGYYVLTYVLIYYLLNYLIRWILLVKLKNKILNAFSRNNYTSNFGYLREQSKLRKSTLSGISKTIDLGYVSKKEIKKTELIEDVKQSDIEEVRHQIGNLVCNWLTVIIHLIITAIVVFQFNLIAGIVLFVFGILLTVIIYAMLVIQTINYNSIRKLRDSI